MVGVAVLSLTPTQCSIRCESGSCLVVLVAPSTYSGTAVDTDRAGGMGVLDKFY